MTDRDAMLAAICEHPADDTPRLVYADRCEEEWGELERAAFIRVQCELASVPKRKKIERGQQISPVIRKSRGGDDYCEFISWTDEGLEVGDVVDVRIAAGVWRYGLIVRRLTDIGGGEIEVVCKKTNERDQHDDLRSRERELWERHGTDWICDSLHKLNVMWQELTWSRGFISQIRCSWADFRRVESRLIWVPGGTVECPNCEGAGEFTRGNSDPPYGPCPDCGGHLWSGPYFEPSDHGWDKGTGRIPRPFVASMQPITRVELTTWTVERDAQGIYSHMTTPEGYRFTRLKCERCNGQRRLPPPAGGQMMPRECEKCEGQPLNEWTCDDWPGVTFAMPEAVIDSLNR